MVSQSKVEVGAFAQALLVVRVHVPRCPQCGNITDLPLCSICSDTTRDATLLCIVEDATNLLAIERGGTYHGLYYVLEGLISPLEDRGPDAIGMEGLFDRIATMPDLEEVILGISPTVEGEATTLFLAEVLKEAGMHVSRIASGIPLGGNLEYYDELTLSRALEDRRSIE